MFRFTIRDVLWLMVVVGLACGWAIEHWRLQEEVSRGFSIRLRDREADQRQRDALTKRIVKLEKSLVDAGVQVPQEPPGMTIGELLTALEKAEKGRKRK